MKNYSKTIRLLALALIFVVIIVLLYLFLFTKIKKESELVLLLGSDIELEVLEEQRFLSIKSLVRDIEKEQEELDSRFVSDEGIVAFLEEIEELGSKTNAVVEINAVDVESASGSAEENSATESLRVSVKAKGNWSGVFHTLLLLETMPFSLSVQDAQFSVLSGREGQVWSGSFNLLVDKLK